MGCCGKTTARSDFEVVLPDGTTVTVGSMMEVRALRAQYQVPGGKAVTYRAVSRGGKTA